MSDLDERVIRAIRKLSIAVWALVFVTALSLAVSILSHFRPSLLSRHGSGKFPARFYPGLAALPNPHQSFLELEEQIQNAGVIILTKWQKADGTLKCIVSEILKQTPDAIFPYKAGDEFPSGNRTVRDDVSYGDGQIIFLTGSSDESSYAVSYRNDQIGGIAGIPVSDVRKAIQKH